MTTTDRDLGAKAIIAELEKLYDAEIETGLFEGEQHPGSDLSLAGIGAVQEFGSVSRNIPERSWLRRAVIENSARWEKDLEKGYKRLLDARGKVPALSMLIYVGELMASDVRKTIDRVTTPPKAPATLAREGARFTHPLIFLGYMRAAVRSRIGFRGSKRFTPKGARR